VPQINPRSSRTDGWQFEHQNDRTYRNPHLPSNPTEYYSKLLRKKAEYFNARRRGDDTPAYF
jgi:hypothetical protein